MTRELTALAPPTMFALWYLHQCEGIPRIGSFFQSPLSTFQQIVTSHGKYDESSPLRAHDADHVRDIQRARHERGDPGWFVSVCFETHDGIRDGLWRRFVAHSSFRGVAKPLSLFVETFRIPRHCSCHIAHHLTC